MPLGVVSITLQDGGLGVISAGATNQVVVMGVCSGTNTPSVTSYSQPEDLVTAAGQGPGVEAACHKLAVAGGSVLFVPINASVAGVAGAVTAHAVGTGTITISGTPYDGYQLYVKVVSNLTGAASYISTGNVRVQVSEDNGVTFGPSILVPSTGTLPLTKAAGAVPQNTGLTLTFSGTTTTWLLSDYHTNTCQAPYYAAADFTAAATVLLASPLTWGIVHVVGYPTVGSSSANATASGVQVTAIGVAAAAALAAGRDAIWVAEIPPSTDADLVSSFASVATTKGLVTRCATTDVIVSSLTGAQRTFGHASALVARLATITASHSPGVVDDGPLPGVVSTARDERVSPGLYDLGFDVSRTILGRSGVYCDDGRTDASIGSDFTTIMNRRVINLVLGGVRNSSLHFQNQSFQTDSLGHLSTTEINNIQNYVAGQVSALAGTEFSAVTVSVYSLDNILSTQNLRYKVRVRPLAYAHDVTVDVGFTNPALIQQ
jgi:hypothetical protein